MPDRKFAMFPRPNRAAPAVLAIALLAGVSPRAISSADAQVTTNNSALDALGGASTAPKQTTPKDDTAEPRHHATAMPATHRAAAPAAEPAAAPAPSATEQKMAPLPPALVSPPPPIPVVAPPVVDVPLHPAPMPPPLHPDDKATGSITPLPGKNGLRIVIANGGVTLSTSMIDRVRSGIAQPVLDNPRDRVEIDAFGGADGNDQSAPRRASLERGLLIRSLLMHEGVAATRIYVRALGATRPPHLASEDGEDPATLPSDRTDVLIVTEAAPIPVESTLTSAALPPAMGGAAATAQPPASVPTAGKEPTR